MLYSYIVLLINVSETIYSYGNLPFFKILINHFMPQDNSPGAILWVLRHFLSLISRLLIALKHRLKTSRGVLFLSPSDVYVRSFLYLFYTLIKYYYIEALSSQPSSLALDWILLLWRPRIPASFVVQKQAFRSIATNFIKPFFVTFIFSGQLWGKKKNLLNFQMIK